MVTHYRHEHMPWDRRWRDIKRNYGEAVYIRQKRIICDDAKRQIIHRARAFLIAHQITVEHFERMPHTSEATISLARTALEGPDVMAAAVIRPVLKTLLAADQSPRRKAR
jgi:hypothetical protein